MKKLSLGLFASAFLFLIGCGGPQAENQVEATAPAEETTAPAPTPGGAYVLSTDQSTINWKGWKKFVTKEHDGTLKFTSGSLQVQDGLITGGELVADMNTIVTNDLAGTEWAAKLEGHLKSDDFFSVATFPTSVFTVTSSVAKADDTGNTHEITGNLTLKGIVKQITFPAKVTLDGSNLNATATFTIDRSQWEVKFGSESFFSLGKDDIIENSIQLTLNIVAAQQQS